MSLKGNQDEIHSDVKEHFEKAKADGSLGSKAATFETTEKDHGRIEIRKYWLVTDLSWLPSRTPWVALESVGAVESTRIIGEKSTTETRYFLSSLGTGKVRKFAGAVRAHWEIENGLHWCLDVAMNEDQSRIRAEHAAENYALLRKIALNLFKQDKTRKRGLEAKQRYAGWDRRSLLQVLFGTPKSTASTPV